MAKQKSMAKQKRTNPVVLRPGMTIGANAAEMDDEFLLKCFVHYPPVELCMNVASRGMVIDGRTGSGKTAIMKFIHSKAEYSVEIDPSEMAMSYVSNSDALNFLHAIGADLDLLFQALWKHVLCIEFIRLKFSVTNETNSRSVFERLRSRFSRDDRKARAIRYLKDWEGKFWITMDQNIKELTERVEKAVKAELGAEIEKFKAGGQYEKRLSTDKKSEFVSRVRKIISSDQLAELAGVIEMLSESEGGDDMKHFYILIDKLDEHWVDVSLRFKLIRALIESLKSFRRITNLKILVALRSDVLERVVQETRDLTFQREKLDDYFVHIRWTKPLLRQLVNSRIQSLFRGQYADRVIEFQDVFPFNVGNVDAFDYIVERTLMRPRDVIAFVNECIEVAQGSYEVTSTMIRRAESNFSRIRRDALEQEWQSAFPSIKRLLDFVGTRQKATVTLEELCSPKEVDDIALAIYSEKKIDYDPLYELASTYYEKDNRSAEEMVKAIVGILYRVGAIGVKLKNGSRFMYSHLDDALLPAAQFTEDARVRIHPMLWGAFHLQAA
ncbi:DNA repair ATPase [Bradyrhizobium sp. 157]|uniref:P-loop ATPase, Sll1717 family n=1 Tax=Bradyrhizobium sp. 157 TaxID=2782631 RepID=UPI001FFAF704|nr:hypothetical protein [Bradyrhizobium sp. 157]MCK1640469.1 DNA repair ATPase [Bradyrhizobium sp. 157]